MLLVAAFTTGCKDRGVTEPAPADTSGGPIDRKPNLYLYPTSKQTISVTLEFPHGGRILDSDPPYGSGWTVEVDPNGRINGRYDYLYYEAQTEDRYQYSSGWVVQKDTLHQFFLKLAFRVEKLAIFSTTGFRDCTLVTSTLFTHRGLSKLRISSSLPYPPIPPLY